MWIFRRVGTPEYAAMEGRADQEVCLTVAREGPKLIFLSMVSAAEVEFLRVCGYEGLAVVSVQEMTPGGGVAICPEGG